MQERAEQLYGGRIGPVEVVEHEYDRLRAREQLQQLAHCAVAPVPLVLKRHILSGRERRQRRKDHRQFGSDVIGERGEPPRLEPLDVLVESVYEDPERQVLLELRSRAGEDQMSTCVRLVGELGEQACLADPGLADEHDRRRGALFERGQEIAKRAKLDGTSDEMLGDGHVRHPG